MNNISALVCQVAVPILEKELSTISIPDISGSADTPIGTVDYWLRKLVKMQSCCVLIASSVFICQI